MKFTNFTLCIDTSFLFCSKYQRHKLNFWTNCLAHPRKANEFVKFVHKNWHIENQVSTIAILAANLCCSYSQPPWTYFELLVRLDFWETSTWRAEVIFIIKFLFKGAWKPSKDIKRIFINFDNKKVNSLIKKLNSELWGDEN